jgi:FkbM family methyltransferase
MTPDLYRAIRRWRARRGGSLRARERYFVEARATTRYLSVEVEGATYLVSPTDEGVERDLFIRRFRPELRVLARTTQVLTQYNRRPSTLVDVGANIGTTTIPALRDYRFTTAVACEPDAESATLLRANCVLNQLDDRVTVIEAAVSDVEGEAFLDTDTSTRGTRALLANPQERPSAVAIRSVTLDGLCERGAIDPEKVGLLWIDVQGHEVRVLSGAGTLLQHRPPLVLALRQGKLDDSERQTLLDVLRERYDLLVNLRKPNLRETSWQPAQIPVDEIVGLLAAKRETDILALSARAGD